MPEVQFIKSDENVMIRDFIGLDEARDGNGTLEVAFGSYVASNATSNAYGYRTLTYNFFDQLRERKCQFTLDAPDALHFVPCGWFDPVPGKRNWLYTMIENEAMGNRAIGMLNKADHIMVPSEWNADIYRKRLRSDLPISVVPLGVDERYAYIERDFPSCGEPFRFLWVGAMSPRKGWQELLWGWKGANFFDYAGLELYLKTTLYRNEGSVRRIGNIVMDSRNFSIEQMVELYHSAHAFVLPTRGEAFALTLAEAMRTGLPCIAPLNGGQIDYFNDSNGYTVDCFEALGNFIPGDGEKPQLANVLFPDVGSLLRQIINVSSGYEGALEKGRRAAEAVGRFTWKKATDKMVSLIESVQKEGR